MKNYESFNNTEWQNILNTESDSQLIYNAINLNLPKSQFYDIVNTISNIDYTNNVNINLLLWSIYKYSLETVKYILDRGANINIQDNNGETVLMWAFDDAELEVFDFLVKSGADWSLKSKKGEDIIEFAKNVENRMDNYEDYDEKIQIVTDPNYPELMNIYLRNKKANDFNI